MQRLGDLGRSEKAARVGETVLELVDDSDRELRSRIHQSLAFQHSVLGNLERAMSHLDRASETEPLQLPAIDGARGQCLQRAGDLDGALKAFDLAIPGLSTSGSRAYVAALLNRGHLHMKSGRLALALQDTEQAQVAARAQGNLTAAGMARHNVGYLYYLRGELPAALEAMAGARDELPDTQLGVPDLDRARVLMMAGLLQDAKALSAQAVRYFALHRAVLDRAEALLVAAELELMTSEPTAARRNARIAAALYRRRGLKSAELVAQLAVRRAELAAFGSVGRPSKSGLDTDSDLAELLDESGLHQDAAVAWLVSAESYLALGRPVQARAAAEHAQLRSPPIAMRLHQRLVAGRIALATGETRRGLGELRRGLDDLADFQSRFGSQDMQSGAAVHGSQLAKLGLRMAIESKSSASVLQWLERARAVSTRLAAVHPPSDPELTELLGALRYTSTEARAAALAGHPDLALQKKIVDIRRRVRARSWTVTGSGAVQRPMSLTTVQRLLSSDVDAPTIVAYITGPAQVFALVITARKARLIPLGDWDDDDRRHRARSADMDMLAAPGVPPRLRAVARTSIDRHFEQLTRQLVEPIEKHLTDGPVVVAAVGELATVPWSLLPGLTGRAISVASSVTSAMASSGRPARAHLRGVLAVAGPEVPHGAKEAEQVAALHPGAGLLIEDQASGEALLAQLPSGGLVHIAAHGHHEPESPLFSSVLLGDGPLYGYDIASSSQLPDHVVLSSCDVGRSHVRPGGEPLGLAAALLRSGVSTVVAGVSRISDSVALGVMVSYHEGLLAGASPAAALAAAVGSVDDELAAFNCFGSGN